MQALAALKSFFFHVPTPLVVYARGRVVILTFLCRCSGKSLLAQKDGLDIHPYRVKLVMAPQESLRLSSTTSVWMRSWGKKEGRIEPVDCSADGMLRVENRSREWKAEAGAWLE